MWLSTQELVPHIEDVDIVLEVGEGDSGNIRAIASPFTVPEDANKTVVEKEGETGAELLANESEVAIVEASGEALECMHDHEEFSEPSFNAADVEHTEPGNMEKTNYDKKEQEDEAASVYQDQDASEGPVCSFPAKSSIQSLTGYH